jgi:hypothetical protein
MPTVPIRLQFGTDVSVLITPGPRSCTVVISLGDPDGDPPAREPAIAGDGHRTACPADDRAAVAAYRLSVKAGSALSERRLAEMFGRTSRRWARARIADACREDGAAG